MLVLVVLALATFAQVGSSTLAAATAVTSNNPLVVDGDPIESLVSSEPPAAVFYAIGANALHRSNDGGQTWRRTGAKPPDGVLVPATDDPSVLLAGDHPPCARGDAGGAGARSTDAGATWNPLAGAIGIRPVASWVDTSLAIGISCSGLEVSTDLGSTWTVAWHPGGNYDLTGSVLAPSDNPAEHAVLVVATSEGGTSELFFVTLSTSGEVRLTSPLRSFWGFGAPAATESELALGSASGVAVSNDGGQSWSEHRTGLELVTISVDPLYEIIPEAEQQRGFGIYDVVFDTKQPDKMYAGTVDGIYESSDGGATWSKVAGIDGVVLGVILSPEQNLVYALRTGDVIAV